MKKFDKPGTRMHKRINVVGQLENTRLHFLLTDSSTSISFACVCEIDSGKWNKTEYDTMTILDAMLGEI